MTGIVWTVWVSLSRVIRERDKARQELESALRHLDADLATTRRRSEEQRRENDLLRQLRQNEFMFDILDRRFGRRSRWLLRRRMELQREYFEELKREIREGDYTRVNELPVLRQVMDVDLMEYTGGGVGGDEKRIDSDLDEILKDLIRRKLVLSVEAVQRLAAQVESTGGH